MGTNYGKSFLTINAALKACKAEGVQEVFATLWSNGGGENNYYTSLLGLQLFSEHSYSKKLSQERLKERFEFCNRGCYNAFFKMGLSRYRSGSRYGAKFI